MPSLEPGTVEWDRAVAEGITADTARNWRLGDIALAIAPIGEEGGTDSPCEQRLIRYADDIGVTVDSLRTYRQVAYRRPPVERGVHRETCSP